MSVFLTGPESFIGRALITRCQSLGIPVVGVDSVAPSSNVSKMIFVTEQAFRCVMM